MRLGICQVPYQHHGWLAPQPTLASWQAARKIGITDVRLQFNLALVSPTVNTWDTSLFEKWARPANDSKIRINANIVAGDNPPAHHTAAFRHDAARRLAAELGDLIDSYGLGNEPGLAPWITDDISREGGTVDRIRETYFPEFVVPVVNGIRAVNPNAIITGFEADGPEIQLRCMTAAKELGIRIDVETVHPYGDVGGGDYATMAKFDEVYKRDLSRPRFVGEIDHQQFPGAGPAATDEQIGRLTDFARMIAGTYPDCRAIYFGTPEYFFTRVPAGELLPGITWSTWTIGEPEVSQSGRALSRVFTAINSRHRPSGKP